MNFLILAMLFVSPLSAQEPDASPVDPEVAAFQAKIDSVKAVRTLARRRATVEWADSIVVADALAVDGVSFMIDKDEHWLVVDVPLSTSTQFERGFWLSKLAEARDKYWAKDVSEGRVRMRKDRAIKFLESTKNDLEIGG